MFILTYISFYILYYLMLLPYFHSIRRPAFLFFCVLGDGCVLIALPSPKSSRDRTTTSYNKAVVNNKLTSDTPQFGRSLIQATAEMPWVYISAPASFFFFQLFVAFVLRHYYSK